MPHRNQARAGLYCLFLKSVDGTWAPDVAAREGPIFRWRQALAAPHRVTAISVRAGGDRDGAFATADRARRFCTAGVAGRRDKVFFAFEPPTSATINAPDSSGSFLKYRS